MWLSNPIYYLIIFASTPLTKDEELSEPYFLESSTASLIATPLGISSSNLISYTASLSIVRSAFPRRFVGHPSEFSLIISSISGSLSIIARVLSLIYSL